MTYHNSEDEVQSPEEPFEKAARRKRCSPNLLECLYTTRCYSIAVRNLFGASAADSCLVLTSA